MTLCPFIQADADRLPRHDRPSSFVLDASEPQKDHVGTPRLLHQPPKNRGVKAQTDGFGLLDNGVATASTPTATTLSPQTFPSPRGFLPERFSNAGRTPAKPRSRSTARIGKSSSKGASTAYVANGWSETSCRSLRCT